jgi:hypothetical protein
MKNKDEKLESDVNWNFVFEIILFFINGIEPYDLRDFSKTGNIKEYFQNKYTITKRNNNG